MQNKKNRLCDYVIKKIRTDEGTRGARWDVQTYAVQNFRIGPHLVCERDVFEANVSLYFFIGE